MATPLLVTKLFRPVPRSDLVYRHRLIALLNEVFAPGCRMALVCAPAGFGKTTLVSGWAADCGCPVAWLSLDDKDDDPSSFWYYVAAALDGLADAEGTIATLLQGSLTPSVQPLLVELINRLSQFDSPAALILDDYHSVTDPAIHADMVYLTEHLPPTVRLVLITRSNPPWPLGRLRGRGQMVELRAADLRFTPDEVGSYLNDVMGLALPEASVTALGQRTEGWVASLHLAALSLRGRDDTDAFVSSFSASHRFVLDYLIEEVLDRQPQDVQTFLLQTSILDRMSGPLCDAVTGRSDSQGLLEQLDSANLFIVPLDDARRWYRYHHLFGEMLRQRLEQRHPGDANGLHERASIWYESGGLVPEAMHHALVAGSVEQAARVVEGNVMAMLDHGELRMLGEWLDRLPLTVTRTRPWLCLAYAWLLAYTGEPDKASEFLACAEAIRSGYEGAGRSDEARHIAGHIAAVRAYGAGYERDFPRVVELADEALRQLPASDAMTRCFAALLKSSMLRRMGELSAAAEPLELVLDNKALPSDSHTAILARANLGILRGVQGRLRKAAAIFRGILADQGAAIGSGDRPPAATVGLAYLGLAETLREWNDLAEAAHLVREGVARAERWGNADMLSGAYYLLGRVLQASDDEKGMRDALDRALSLAKANIPGAVPVVQAECAEVLLSYGDVRAAITWAEACGLHVDDDFSFQDRRSYITLARVFVAQARWGQAQTLLPRLLEATDHVGAVTDLIQVLAVLALVRDAQGSKVHARADLARALALAEPEGFVRIFLDLGTPMLALLEDARSAGIAPGYVGALLAAATLTQPVPVDPQPSVVSQVGSSHQDELIEPLSDRELEILLLLRSSLTNREIADRLYVSVNTVRTHVRHVYEKLGVHRRLDAIDRAHEMGLL